MIGYDVHGFPRPVGSAFRQRTIWAARRYGDDSNVPWMVSVVDTLAGPAIEARNHLDPKAIIATDLASHTTSVQDVIAKAKEQLDQSGWTDYTVPVCGVSGCDNPRPMWASVRPNIQDGTECLWCQLRTVLACKECGAPDAGHYVQGVRERLLRDSLCFGCALWTDRLAAYDDKVWGADGCMYGIGNGRGPKEMRGYGGAAWIVTFTDGRAVETDDLWNGGEVPAWFRDRLPANATVERKSVG